MDKTLPILLSDFYKQVHAEMYNENIGKLVSYYTPRMSRLGDKTLINFGLQAFCKEYLIDYFNQYFFSKPEKEVVEEYNRVLTYTLGKGTYKDDKIRKLHQLGYLPIEIKEVPEGTRVPIHIPMFEISNTHPDFAWVTNAIESLVSCQMWHTQLSANIGCKYRKIVEEWYGKTVNDSVPVNRALGDFSFRGQHSLESATKSSAAFCLSFLNTATVPAIPWLERNYNCDCTKEPVAFGAISTEHSVMCSNYSIDGDEKTFLKKLITEIYPNSSFSVVSDSYDYWNLITNILPELKEEILNHNGTVLIRGDSGDPVDIICGKKMRSTYAADKADLICQACADYLYDRSNVHFYYTVNADTGERTDWIVTLDDNGSATVEEVNSENLPIEYKGTVQILWEIFGGTTNSKEYKVLDPHIKAIYGDSITPQRCEEIYERLEAKGFASNNVSLGVGSFSFMCMEDSPNVFKPYTRDTYGIAIKTTYGELKDGTPIMIFKNPKTDTGHFKKSQKGLCYVYQDESGIIACEDEYTSENFPKEGNLMETIFKDGKMVKEYSLKEVRDRLWEGKF